MAHHERPPHGVTKRGFGRLVMHLVEAQAMLVRLQQVTLHCGFESWWTRWFHTPIGWVRLPYPLPRDKGIFPPVLPVSKETGGGIIH